MSEFDVVVIGAGAAGIAAARRLAGTGLTVKVIEARTRLGGRAFTTSTPTGAAIDLGCGWLHSAEDNDWAALAPALGFSVDRTTPAWQRPALECGFPAADQQQFRAELDAVFARLADAGGQAPDRPVADLVPAGTRWRDLMDAVSTWINGVEFDQVSVHDLARYSDSGANWRVVGGYGALVAAAAAGLDVATGTAAVRIDHAGSRLHVDTRRGRLTADAVIVTVPTATIASGALAFSPALPDKVAAATALPLGIADKLFLRVDDATDLPVERRLYGATEGRIASYDLRPFGTDLIETYVGGALARDLEAEGEAAFCAFAVDQLAARLGSAIRNRLSLVAATAWARDPFAGGSYSYARVGASDMRAVLAAPVDGRLFFAGEATSRHDFSTAHGAYRTGVRAAEDVLTARAADASRRR